MKNPALAAIQMRNGMTVQSRNFQRPAVVEPAPGFRNPLVERFQRNRDRRGKELLRQLDRELVWRSDTAFALDSFSTSN